jgi:tripartite-type tricarboxylate transporter receptor subunit TctC
MMRGTLVRLAALALLAWGLVAPAQAQDFPSRPITIVIPFPVGSQADVINRMIFDRMERSLGQKIIVENRPGAGGTVGTDRVAKAAPDGYTLVSGSAGTHAAAISLFRNVPYDPVADFAPITMLSGGAHILVVNSAVGVKTLADLIKLAKERPGQLAYASTGNGTTPHFQAALLVHLAGIDVRHVPYSTVPQAVADLARGDVQMMFYPYAPLQNFIQSGQLIMLGTSGDTRSATVPEIPTLKEQGLSEYSLIAWSALFAPANTPRAAINKLYDAAQDALHDTELQAKILRLGTEVMIGSPTQVAELQRMEIAKYRKLVEVTGARLD